MQLVRTRWQPIDSHSLTAVTASSSTHPLSRRCRYFRSGYRSDDAHRRNGYQSIQGVADTTDPVTEIAQRTKVNFRTEHRARMCPRLSASRDHKNKDIFRLARAFPQKRNQEGAVALQSYKQ